MHPSSVLFLCWTQCLVCRLLVKVSCTCALLEVIGLTSLQGNRIVSWTTQSFISEFPREFVILYVVTNIIRHTKN